MNILNTIAAAFSPSSNGADVSPATDNPFEAMGGSALVTAYNAMVKEAEAAGLTGYREVSRFADKVSAVKRCTALQSSLRAHTQGQAAADRQEGATYSELKVAGGLRSEPVPAPRYTAMDESNPGDEQPPVSSAASYGPGMDRLRAQGDAEAMRQRTLEAQERAREEVSEMARKKKDNEAEPKAKKNGHLSAEKARVIYNGLVESLTAAGVEGLKTFKSEGGPVVARQRFEALKEKLRAEKHPMPPEIKEVLATLP